MILFFSLLVFFSFQIIFSIYLSMHSYNVDPNFTIVRLYNRISFNWVNNQSEM